MFTFVSTLKLSRLHTFLSNSVSQHDLPLKLLAKAKSSNAVPLPIDEQSEMKHDGGDAIVKVRDVAAKKEGEAGTGTVCRS